MTNVSTSNRKLSLDDLKACRRELSNAINVVRNEAFEALENRKITSAQFQDARDNWQDLQIKESKLLGEIISRDISFLLDTNVDSPRTRIIQATDKLTAAARQIQQFQQFLDTIADVIEIFTSLLKAIRQGIIANISNISTWR